MDSAWIHQEAQRTLKRLSPRMTVHLGKDKDIFFARLETHFPTIFRLLYGLYGTRYDFFYHLEQVCLSLAMQHSQRPNDLKALDKHREKNPEWFKDGEMMGAMAYVDLFADNLDGLLQRIPYLKTLGITYLHLMPLFKAPEKDSDGGYAVSDYRTINPKLGTMQELENLTQAFRKEGISLVLDFVFNHTSNEHEWAERAKAGDRQYQDYYYIFPDRNVPDQYERHLREIFPEQDPGNFTYLPKEKLWVWTTFRHFQWDLNYANPEVFNAMLNELLFLANRGVEVLRLDAVAFIWKQMGTVCEGLPQAHEIIQAYNALVKVVAPAMVFKSEAIVHPDIVAQYIGKHESPISYNPTLMALLWEAVATRDVKLLSLSMERRFGLPEGCAWVNYVRCHDDIGWTFADEDAIQLGIHGFPHRQFLNSFYIGRFEGSFSKGVPFNFNPMTHDMRISGMASSLIGIEQALNLDNDELLEHAINRLILIHSVILSVAGIPLLYLGDEIALLNDYSYTEDEAKRVDSRWVHRPRFDWERAEERFSASSIVGRVFSAITWMIAVRKATPALAQSTHFFNTGNTHVLGYLCGDDKDVVAFANFSEHPQTVSTVMMGSPSAHEIYTDSRMNCESELTLTPYQFMWLRKE